jgi:hypothetical protein
LRRGAEISSIGVLEPRAWYGSTTSLSPDFFLKIIIVIIKFFFFLNSFFKSFFFIYYKAMPDMSPAKRKRKGNPSYKVRLLLTWILIGDSH